MPLRKVRCCRWPLACRRVPDRKPGGCLTLVSKIDGFATPSTLISRGSSPPWRALYSPERGNDRKALRFRDSGVLQRAGSRNQDCPNRGVGVHACRRRHLWNFWSQGDDLACRSIAVQALGLAGLVMTLRRGGTCRPGPRQLAPWPGISSIAASTSRRRVVDGSTVTDSPVLVDLKPSLARLAVVGMRVWRHGPVCTNVATRFHRAARDVDQVVLTCWTVVHVWLRAGFVGVVQTRVTLSGNRATC